MKALPGDTAQLPHSQETDTVHKPKRFAEAGMGFLAVLVSSWEINDPLLCDFL